MNERELALMLCMPSSMPSRKRSRASAPEVR